MSFRVEGSVQGKCKNEQLWEDCIVVDGRQRDAVEPLGVTVRLQKNILDGSVKRILFEYEDGSALRFDSLTAATPPGRR
jgi:hypothetical protein